MQIRRRLQKINPDRAEKRTILGEDKAIVYGIDISILIYCRSKIREFEPKILSSVADAKQIQTVLE